MLSIWMSAYPDIAPKARLNIVFGLPGMTDLEGLAMGEAEAQIAALARGRQQVQKTRRFLAELRQGAFATVNSEDWNAAARPLSSG